MRTITRLVLILLLLLIPLPAQSHTEGNPPKHIAKAPLALLKLNQPSTPSRPDFDRDVLVPLRAAQTKEAAEEKIAANRLAKAMSDCKATGGTFANGACTLPSPAPVAAPVASYPAVTGNSAKAYIYEHESGNDPTRWNTSGCLGLGQACPASKLLVVCPTMDYGCEDQFFTNYMIGRYGTWENAYAFWTRTDPRPYPGHWW